MSAGVLLQDLRVELPVPGRAEDHGHQPPVSVLPVRTIAPEVGLGEARNLPRRVRPVHVPVEPGHVVFEVVLDSHHVPDSGSPPGSRGCRGPSRSGERSRSRLRTSRSPFAHRDRPSPCPWPPLRAARGRSTPEPGRAGRSRPSGTAGRNTAPSATRTCDHPRTRCESHRACRGRTRRPGLRGSAAST